MTDTTIGEITGVATTTQTLTGLKITVVDASGYSVTSASFTWTVKATVSLRNVASTSFCDVTASNVRWVQAHRRRVRFAANSPT